MVSFCRTIKRGADGPDVGAISHHLHRVGIRQDKRTNHFGKGMEKQLKEFQRRQDLKVDGVYGQRTHEAMAKRFDETSRTLYRKCLANQPRDRLRRVAMFAFCNRGVLNYTQSAWRYWSDPSGRMYGVRRKVRIPNMPRWEDCSSFVTWCYWHAGLPDPNGRGYDGYGFTGTMQSRGRAASLSALRVGDLIFYGSGSISHVTIYVGDGKCVSHGSSAGPLLLPVRYRSDVRFARRYISD